MRVIIFGAGRVGSAMALDLAAEEKFEVTIADIDAEALRRLAGVERLTPVRADLRTVDMIQRLAGAHDLVVGAVPGPMGYGMVRSVIDAGRDIVDISFFEEEPATMTFGVDCVRLNPDTARCNFCVKILILEFIRSR